MAGEMQAQIEELPKLYKQGLENAMKLLSIRNEEVQEHTGEILRLVRIYNHLHLPASLLLLKAWYQLLSSFTYNTEDEFLTNGENPRLCVLTWQPVCNSLTELVPVQRTSSVIPEKNTFGFQKRSAAFTTRWPLT